MKWNKLFSRGRRRGHETSVVLFDDDSVHKNVKHRSASEQQDDKEQDDQQLPLHEHHADDRTEVTHTSSSSIDISAVELSPKQKAHSVPRNIIQNHDCNSILETPRSETVVQFSTVEMRHYQRIVGDHPDVEIPLAIGWEFVQGSPVSVNELEDQKEARKLESEHDLLLPFTTTHGHVMSVEPSRLHTTNSNGSPKVLQRATAFSENLRNGLLSHKQFLLAQHKNSTDIANKYLEPISVKQRVFLLRTVGGYSLKQIQLAERRRRVQIVLEWAYRKDAQDQNDPCTVRNCSELFKRYII